MPWAGNIAKTMTSNGKQFTVTREMLTAVAGISARYSKFAFVLFCYITNHLMTGPLGNSEFCFPRISMFPSTSSRETLRFSGNKIHCSPRDQSLSVYYRISWKFCFRNFDRTRLISTTPTNNNVETTPFKRFMTNLRKWEKLTRIPGFPTSTVKPKSYGDKTLMSFVCEARVASFPMWLFNFQIADTCTHCVPIFNTCLRWKVHMIHVQTSLVSNMLIALVCFFRILFLKYRMAGWMTRWGNIMAQMYTYPQTA